MQNAGALLEAAAERIAAACGLQVQSAVELREERSGQPMGGYRTLVGSSLDKAVVVNLELEDEETPGVRNEIHSLYAFSLPSTLAPHLALEWGHIEGPEGEDGRLSVFVDLLPRLDLAVNQDYIDELYEPLTPVLVEAWDIKGARSDRHLPRRIVAFSPWRFSASAPASEVDALLEVVDRYTDHWLATLSGGVGASVDPLASDPSRLVQRDKYHREAMFDEKAMAHWSKFYQALSFNDAAELRHTLRSQQVR